MVPVSVPLNVPPPDALVSVTVVRLVGLDGLPLASSDVTVTLKGVPAVPVPGTVVNTNFVATPAENTMPLLVAAVKPVSPAVAVAVNVNVSDLE
jgi:hypothetical protein